MPLSNNRNGAHAQAAGAVVHCGGRRRFDSRHRFGKNIISE